MAAAESTIVFLPRFTMFAGAGEYITQPLDVSQFASAQFQFGRAVSAGELRLYLEESLDCVEWTLGASAPKGVVIASSKTKFFSYGFRLRWFRLRVMTTGDLVTCWAEGILR